MKEYITGKQFCEMVMCASDALEANKQTINELNVFPVPDGDTGTNMSLTLSAAANEFRKKKYDNISEAADKTASALLRGARGNSGVILSLLFRGISKSLKGFERAYAADFAAAMCDGVDVAYKAVMKPAEGTILTVSRVATCAALDLAQAEDDIERMFSVAIEAGKEALAVTVEQNPVLKRAGVIDAGGKGYVIMLEAMLAYLQGRAVVNDTPVVTEVHEHADFGVFDTSEIEFAYDTVFIVSKTDDRPLDLLRAYLDSIGDSLVISEGDDMFKVHVHTNIPGEALTEASKYGILETAKIENMRTQHEELVEDHEHDHEHGPAQKPEPEEDTWTPVEPEKRYGFVAVCAGQGMAELFQELGADRIVTGGQTMNPSTEDILREIDQTPAETVFVFPNNKNIIMAAEQCVPLTDKKVIVIPTRTVPEGISAMLNLDTYASEEDIVETCRRVMENVHTAQITYAARDSEFDGQKIYAGEYLGLLDSALVGSYTDINELFSVLCQEFEELSPEFISVYYGGDVTEEQAQQVSDLITISFPDAAVSLVNGGQPVYYYMISVE